MINLDDIISREKGIEEIKTLNFQYDELKKHYENLCNTFDKLPTNLQAKTSLQDTFIQSVISLFNSKGNFKIEKYNEKIHEITFGNFDMRIIKKDDFITELHIFREATYSISVIYSSNSNSIFGTEKIVPYINEESDKNTFLNAIEVLRHNISIMAKRIKETDKTTFCYVINNENKEYETSQDVINSIFK